MNEESELHGILWLASTGWRGETIASRGRGTSLQGRGVGPRATVSSPHPLPLSLTQTKSIPFQNGDTLNFAVLCWLRVATCSPAPQRAKLLSGKRVVSVEELPCALSSQQRVSLQQVMHLPKYALFSISWRHAPQLPSMTMASVPLS